MNEFENEFNNKTSEEESFDFDEKSSQNDSPLMNEVFFSPVTPNNDYKPQNKGIKVFALIMVAVIVLTGCCIGGYFVGKNSVIGGNKDKVNINLASKPTDTDQLSVSQVYDKVNESVVGIRVYNHSGSTADASGVIYSKDGYIVTNDHIYSKIPAAKFKIYMYDGTERDAVYVAGDTVSDLAVLKLNNASNLTVNDFGNSDEILYGEDVVAIGRPSDAADNSSVTSGIVSLPSRRMKTTSSYSASLIQTDSAINPGSSGGALVNRYGQIIGITSSKLAGVEYDAVGFAIPTKTVKRVVEQLISDGRVTDRAKLGITYTEIDSITAELKGLNQVGLCVVTVSEESDIFGKVSEGDIITHVNGTEITSDETMLDVIENCKAGDQITLSVLSGNSSKDFNVILKANYGESSYVTAEGGLKMDEDDSSDNSNGTFDFPFGE